MTNRSRNIQFSAFSYDDLQSSHTQKVLTGISVTIALSAPLVFHCRAWRDGGELPFLIDNVRDLQRLLDFLEAQPFVDPERIGMAGVSLGGMHTWLCAAMDTRVAAAAPLIGVQGFQWAINNNAFHGRVDSLKRAFQLIAKECGKVC